MTEDGSGSGPTDRPFSSVDTTCPSCGDRMRPKRLRSGSLVLHCRACGQVAVV